MQETRAFATRKGREIASNDWMASVWAKSVAAHDAATSPSKGSFSSITRRGINQPPSRKTGCLAASARIRFSGQ